MGGKKVFELMLEVGHKSQPLKAKLANGYTHKWCVFVRGANGVKIEHCVQRVVFKLHESFPDPHREITESPFQVKETGYAGFEIPIEVHFKNRDKTSHCEIMLDLTLLTTQPNAYTKVEKIKFYNPNKEFERCLKAAGANVLTVPKDKKDRSDSPPAKRQKSYSLIPSKDMSNKQSGQQAQSHSQHNSNNNHSHSSSTPLTSQIRILPPAQAQQQPEHHQKSNSSWQLNHNNHHGGSYSNHSHSNNKHNNVSNHHSSSNNNNNNNNNHSSNSSNSLLGNHTSSLHSNHQSNHQTTKQSSQQQSLLPKPKSSSKDLMDVFGAPLIYNNNKSQKVSNGKDHSSDNQKDVPMVTTTSRSPIPPVVRQPSPQVSTPQSHGHQSHSHHHKSSHRHHHHKKHHHHHSHHHNQAQIKQEPIEALRTPPPPPPAQVAAPKKTPQKDPAPKAVAFIAQTDPFQVLQGKISSLTDSDRLQKIVDIIEESGEWFNLTPNKFEFDLKRLDKKTLSKIEKCLP